jgi:excisionase family DNA binding protein
MHELMTIGETAEALRISERLVRRWRDEGKLLCVRLPGKLTRFRRKDVEALLTPVSRSSVFGRSDV